MERELNRCGGLFPAGSGKADASGAGGTILVQCLFIFALLSLVAVGVVESGGIGNAISGVLQNNVQARLHAYSGIEMAYCRLSDDQEYAGETFMFSTSPDTGTDITVAPIDEVEYDVVSRGFTTNAECVFHTQVDIRPRVFDYAVTVGNDMNMAGMARIMGDCFVADDAEGNSSAVITGDLDLTKASGGDLPTVNGEVRITDLDITFPAYSMSDLRTQAQTDGYYHSGGIFHVISNQDLTGVVFIESCWFIGFENVTIDGVLVLNSCYQFWVDDGYLKVKRDVDIAGNTAILAPYVHFKTNPNTTVDIYGLAYVRSAQLRGDGTFSGPVLVIENFRTLTGATRFQVPAELKGPEYGVIDFNEFRLTETLYEEL